MRATLKTGGDIIPIILGVIYQPIILGIRYQPPWLYTTKLICPANVACLGGPDLLPMSDGPYAAWTINPTCPGYTGRTCIWYRHNMHVLKGHLCRISLQLGSMGDHDGGASRSVFTGNMLINRWPPWSD